MDRLESVRNKEKTKKIVKDLVIFTAKIIISMIALAAVIVMPMLVIGFGILGLGQILLLGSPYHGFVLIFVYDVFYATFGLIGWIVLEQFSLPFLNKYFPKEDKEE